jgi:hypothetical protein
MALKIFTGAKPFLKAQFITEMEMLLLGCKFGAAEVKSIAVIEAASNG